MTACYILTLDDKVAGAIENVRARAQIGLDELLVNMLVSEAYSRRCGAEADIIRGTTGGIKLEQFHEDDWVPASKAAPSPVIPAPIASTPPVPVAAPVVPSPITPPVAAPAASVAQVAPTAVPPVKTPT